MRKLILILPLICLLLTSCLSNDFTVSASLEGGGVSNIYIAYRASSDKQAFVAEQTVPLADGAFTLKGSTRYPAVMWIFSAAHAEMYALYVERGDEISITGKFSDPLLWQVKGNPLMEEYCSWVRANEGVLRSGNPASVNAAVARYVKGNPDNPLSAFLLMSRYTRPGHENEFDSLWASLEQTDETKHIREAFMSAAPDAQARDAQLPLLSLSLPSAADSTVTLNPGKARATVLYLWHEATGKLHHDATSLISETDSMADVQGADIYMGADTTQWQMVLKTITYPAAHSLWALGGAANPALRRLNITVAPIIIVTDRKGNQKYRGTDPAKAREAIKKIK